MILNIYTRVPKKEYDGTCCNLDTMSLNYNSTHLFIASHHWDKLYIELGDEIEFDILKYVQSVCDEVEVKLPEIISEHTVGLLCELYPQRAGKIRKYYMMKKDLMEALRDD